MRPVLNAHLESNIPGFFVAGDLAGAVVIKQAMEQGHRVAAHILAQPDARSRIPDEYDVIVAGAGAAGLNASLTMQAGGLRILILEKGKVAATIEDFPESKRIYAKPEGVPAKGGLWLEECTKEQLLARWQEDIARGNLPIHTGEDVVSVARRAEGGFEVRTSKAAYRCRRFILATGLRGNPRRLGVPGEDSDTVHHLLYSANQYSGENILVVGGGNTAIEAALTLAAKNRVTVIHRGTGFHRLFKENRREFETALSSGALRVCRQSEVVRFDQQAASVRGPEGIQTILFHRAFVLIGADPPTVFLRSLGLRLENEWTWRRFLLLAFSLSLAYAIYGIKYGPGNEFWPFRDWGFRALSFFNRPWAFWYTVLYTLLVTGFGVQAVKRWGFDRRDRFQIWRYTSLIGFQWTFFFLIPEFLFQWAVQYQWLGEALSRDPNFAGNAWRSYGLVYAWPLFFYTFFGSPHDVWHVWGVILSFILMPVLALFHGKRYCSWICGCGGLAETLGDRWRHLAPKGRSSIQWERMNQVVLAAAVAVTLLMLLQDVVAAFRKPAQFSILWYRLIVDVWLVGILPAGLYPIYGGKIWCRYWCPLAKMIEYFSTVFTRLKISRFAIQANDKCIACGECSRYCQVGIDVMNFALKQQELNNLNSSCIGCGICIAVCPMGVLSFGRQPPATSLVQISSNI
jgi:thioredoxin reductase/polyferredoxin